MDLFRSGIVFLFRPFLFVSCYPHEKVLGSDLDVDSESVAFLNKLNLSVCHLVLLYTVRSVHNIVLHIVTD